MRQVGQACTAVVCCRVSPKQKALMTAEDGGFTCRLHLITRPCLLSMRQVGQACAAVVCCRVLPKQKALVTAEDCCGFNCLISRPCPLSVRQVGQACAAVVCCRVSPKQKALVTALVKGTGDTTLGIGDGGQRHRHDPGGPHWCARIFLNLKRWILHTCGSVDVQCMSAFWALHADWRAPSLRCKIPSSNACACMRRCKPAISRLHVRPPGFAS